MRARKRQKLAWACPHKEKPAHAKGMCAMCYMRRFRARGSSSGDPEGFGHPELSLRFQISHNCIICGDGFNELKRKCHLHPDICDACEHEYCECTVEDRVKVGALEDIAAYPEEERIAPLLARKITLRLAGKNTNSVPPIPYQPEDARPEFYPILSRRGTADDESASTENVRVILEEAV